MTKKKLIDEKGDTIPGLFRGSNGMIVVDDQDSFNKYNRSVSHQKKQKETIDEMKQDLEGLKKVLQGILATQEPRN